MASIFHPEDSRGEEEPPAELIRWRGIPRGRVSWWASAMGGRRRRMLTGQKWLQVSASAGRALAAGRQQQQGRRGETDPV